MKLTPLQHITILYLLTILFSYIATVPGKQFIYHENELLENIQAAFLFSSLAVLLVSIPRAEKSLRPILFAGSLFFLTLFLREVDIEDSTLPYIFIQIGSGHGRNIILLSLWIAVFGIVLEHPVYYGRVLRHLLFSNAGALYVIGGLFLLLGEYLDYRSRSLRFYEELAELAGFYFMFAATLSTPETLSDSRLQPATTKSHQA
jgi:hypothetical protein